MQKLAFYIPQYWGRQNTKEGLVARTGFRGGVHPPGRKDATAGRPTERGPVPERLFVPMSQHLGAPCAPVASVGDRVVRGQVLGDVEAMVSAPVHSPVNGEVKAITTVLTAAGQRVAAVEIAVDSEQEFDRYLELPEEDVKHLVRSGGIVGMGGAAFPAAVKLQPPHDMPIDTVILNGCECEPYLTCDHRTMLERPEAIAAGARIIRDTVGAKRIIIGIEDNKPDAAESMRSVAGDDIEVLPLHTRYPQGAEKQLIWAALGKAVEPGKLPASTGALVHNVGTAAAIADAVERRKPLIERTVTLTGAVARPGNYTILLGTLISDLIEWAGGCTCEGARVISGGPMTGFALGDLDVPVTKGTSGIVVLTPDVTAPAVTGDQPCIRCGRCNVACPMFLQPHALGIYANRSDWDECEELDALACIECGCCSYICPTRRPLVQLIRRAKHALMERGTKQ